MNTSDITLKNAAIVVGTVGASGLVWHLSDHAADRAASLSVKAWNGITGWFKSDPPVAAVAATAQATLPQSQGLTVEQAMAMIKASQAQATEQVMLALKALQTVAAPVAGSAPIQGPTGQPVAP